MNEIKIALGNISSEIISGFIAAVFTWLGFWRKTKADLEKEYSLKFNDKKWEVYTEFAGLVRDMVGDNPIDSAELSKREISLASQIVLIGSDDVVTVFHDWRETSSIYGQSHSSTKEILFRLIATMRKDLGNRSSRLSMDILLGALDPIRRQN